jgi:hypothetical protein
MTKQLTYWIPTVLLALLMGPGGVLDVLSRPEVLEILRRLGYPDYFAPMLGVAKLLGVIAILAPVPRTIREWAYAGFTFDLTAAAVSHLVVGGPGEIGPPLIGLVFVALSYRGWRMRLAAQASRLAAPTT